jgi:hypothetical protein
MRLSSNADLVAVIEIVLTVQWGYGRLVTYAIKDSGGNVLNKGKFKVNEDVTDHDRVCAVLYFLRALRSDRVREVSVHVYDQQNLLTPPYSQPPYEVSARLYKDSLDFTTKVTVDATSEQRQHALDFDLSCLSHVGGCQQPCELMPSVWFDYQRRARAEGLAVPPDELGDPRCKRLPD